jgi:cyclophilin family peptidyl-prolyl cis-trans isomerase
MALSSNRLLSKLSLFGQRKLKTRKRDAALYARRSQLRLESLESRYALHGAHIDLADASDLGALNNDNITSATTWSLQVTDVGANSAVRVMHGTDVVGTVDTNTGTARTFTINVAAIADGDIQLTVEEAPAANGVFVPTSLHSFVFTKDTQISAITSTPPATATAGVAYSYNAQHADEGGANLVYSLVNNPSGATIDATSGLVAWTPSATNQVGGFSFGVKATDLAGNSTTQTVNVDVLRPLPAPTAHLHADLSIFVNGTLVNLPDKLGLSATAQIAFPHIEGTDNRIHVHPIDGTNATPPSPITLGDFFNTWRTNAGVPGNNPNATFSSTSLMGNNVVAGTSVVRMYVNGKLNTEYENYVLRDEDDITLTFETVGAANGPTLAPIQNVTVFAGAPLYIPLLGFDPTGQTLTFSATSSNPSILTTGISNTNRSMKVSVAGFGDMTFELFEDKAGSVTDKIIALINANKYDGTIFHRVINGFVTQGGDPNGNGSNDENQPEFDDQFNLELQHTSAGMLSMAKNPLDDTNTSQFFITDGPTRFLDFNHSVFGRLTKGDNVRELISNVAVNNSTDNRPVNNVVMSNVEVFLDPDTGVLMLKAPEGATGTSNVTVTVTDSDGNSFNRTFQVTVAADASNSPDSPPFLGPVNDVTTTSGTAVNVQLTSSDVENNLVTYVIDPKNVDGTNKPYTATVNATNGLVTITPNANFVGTFNVTVGVRQSTNIATISDQFDTQTISVTVTPAAPGVPDLADVSDTGILNNDNITKGGSWQFTVNNVTTGALVKLFSGSTLLGSATATGSTATIAFDSSVLQDGQVQITSEQSVTVNSVVQTSPRSLPLTITKDTVGPAAFDFTTPMPASAIAGQAYNYNFANPDEGTGFTYSLVNAPAGATINAATGQFTFTPAAGQTGAQTAVVRLSDTAGNVREQSVNVSVISDQAQLVKFYVVVTDLQGNEITQIEQGEDFLVLVRVEDVRATPEGVFSAYADMTYDATKVTAVPPITFGNSFPNARSGSATTAGLIDEAGGTGNLTALGDGAFTLYTTRFTATALGVVNFASNPADDTTFHPVLLWNVGAVIPNTQITQAADSLTVVVPTGAVSDELSVIEDSSANTLNVSSNDTLPAGVNGPLTVQSVTQPSAGGAVTLTNGQVQFTPTADFAGISTFTYTVTNGAGFTDTATVNVTVVNTNDPPSANDDTLSINEDAANSVLNVLANDLTAPDPSETLTITSFTQPTSGGTVSLGTGGKSLVFNPTANFNGTVTFTYTVNDGTAGSNDTATVTLTVSAVNDVPTAGADAQTVLEDAAATVINVLANDSFAPDVNETLTVSAISQGSQGGTITLGTGGANVVYTPKANFNGTETFTYTLSDGNGGTATGTVTMTVTAVNDPPNAVDDTATTIKNTGPLTVNVLNNDTAAPDTGETLTITAVTQPTTGGTVTIASDGKSLIYTPTANFSGTATFTYTINDGTSGSNDTATVVVTVQDFIPSDIAGFVYVDANHNGVRDANEAGLVGVTVTLTGSSSGTAVNQAVTTQADGSYKFINIGPGTYKITESQPQFMVDAGETLGVFGGTKTANDAMSFTIPENSHLSGYNFGEAGRQAQFVNMRDFLTSTPVGASMVNLTSSGALGWMQLGPSFKGVTAASASLNSAKTQLTLTITENGQQFSTTLSMTDTAKIQKITESSGALLLKILDARASLGFTAVSSGAQGEAPATTSAASSSTSNNDSIAPQGEASPAVESSSMPGPQGEAFAAPSNDTSSLLTAAYNNVAPTTAGANAVQDSVTNDVVAPLASSLPSYGSMNLVNPTALGGTNYANTGSSSSPSTTDADETEDGEKVESEDDSEPSADEAAAARAAAIDALNDETLSWVDGDAHEAEDGDEEEEAVDAVMADGEWQEA